MIFQVSFENLKQKLKFPVNPSEFTISDGGLETHVINVIKGGERIIIGDKKLEKIAFSSFFPKHYDPTYCEYRKLPKPWQSVKKLEKWRNSGKPVKLLITGTNINMYAVITKFEYGEKGGEPGDVYYSIEFSEFTFIKIREVKKVRGKKKTESKKGRPNTKADSGKYYTVKSGDCLWNIAKKFYGSGSQYTKIYNANKTLIKNPNIIQVGWRLKIP